MSNEQATYTPGPWKATTQTVTAPETEDRLPLDVRIYGGNKQDCAANARLIATAPDQHDLILEMHGWLRVNAGRSDLPQEVRTRMANFADDCRRLIRKAGTAA